MNKYTSFLSTPSSYRQGKVDLIFSRVACVTRYIVLPGLHRAHAQLITTEVSGGGFTKLRCIHFSLETKTRVSYLYE